MKSWLNIIVILFLPILAANAKVKEIMGDEQLWLAAKIEYEISEPLELEFAQKLRFTNNISLLSQYITDIGAYYKFKFPLKVGLFYRLRLYPNTQRSRNEIYTNLVNKIKISYFSFQNRLRLHIKFRDNQETINYLRYRLNVKYNCFKAIHLFAYSEMFYRFMYIKGDRISQGRYACGLEFPIAQSHEISFSYMYETSYNKKNQEYAHIFGVNYTFEF